VALAEQQFHIEQQRGPAAAAGAPQRGVLTARSPSGNSRRELTTGAARIRAEGDRRHRALLETRGCAGMRASRPNGQHGAQDHQRNSGAEAQRDRLTEQQGRMKRLDRVSESSQGMRSSR
jgi:hypothetical protein